MTKRDYYEILQVSKDADAATIKKSYRKVALECHPDRNPDDTEAENRFKEASEAYEVLSDPSRRQVYDTYGHAGLDGAGYHGPQNTDDIFSAFGDIFEDLFGGGFSQAQSRRRGPRPYAGRDRQLRIEISFEDAALGTTRELHVDRHVMCSSCSGSGAKQGTSMSQCRSCGGSGHVTVRQGFFMMQTSCPDCGGAGQKIDEKCPDCHGAGMQQETSTVSLKVPAGIESDMQLVLRGEGDGGGHGGPPGDLYVLVHVKPHESFRRDGTDVHYQLTMTFPELALGTEVVVPTLYGEQKLKVPAGTDPGTHLCLKGQGIKDVRSHHKGHQYVEVLMQTPRKLNRKQKQLIEELASEWN